MACTGYPGWNFHGRGDPSSVVRRTRLFCAVAPLMDRKSPPTKSESPSGAGVMIRTRSSACGCQGVEHAGIVDGSQPRTQLPVDRVEGPAEVDQPGGQRDRVHLLVGGGRPWQYRTSRGIHLCEAVPDDAADPVEGGQVLPGHQGGVRLGACRAYRGELPADVHHVADRHDRVHPTVGLVRRVDPQLEVRSGERRVRRKEQRSDSECTHRHRPKRPTSAATHVVHSYDGPPEVPVRAHGTHPIPRPPWLDVPMFGASSAADSLWSERSRAR